MSTIPTAAPTPASVAAEYFQRDVDWHHTTDVRSKTLVVVHDACYGHRFARPRSSKATLSSIVERPERVRAGVLGVSAAYVRLGRRHAGESYAPHPSLDPRFLPTSPPFQIRKTARSLALTAAPVAHVHGTKWMEDLKTMCDAAESRLALNGKELVRPRSAGKDDRAPEFHQGDLYLCSESLNAFQGALGGVCEGVDAVFNESSSTKRAFVCIRPPGHHCSSGLPSGFCWINNVHVGISYAAMTHGLTHAAILDFDLHHGDGSQDITWEQNKRAAMTPKNAAGYKKARIGYFSLHDINSYPCEMGDFEKVRNASVCIDKAHNQSIWNVHLDPWKNESEFWDLYATKYTVLIGKARAFLRLHTERLASIPNGPAPKAAIFLSAGFDASEWEGAGMQRHKVNVPTDFYARFTADVVRMAEEEGLGADGRVISVLEGGYSDRALTSGVFSHISGLSDTAASHSTTTEPDRVDRLATEMTERLGLHESHPEPVLEQQQHDPKCDPAWWSPASLAELEALVYPPPPAPKGQKSAPTYFAPTQSFAAKVVTPTRDRKSNGSSTGEPEVPIPEVGWATAAHELSKILIPGDRLTTSCRPEELNAEASRQRRERQAAVEGIPLVSHATAAAKAASTDDAMGAPEASRMQLRIRKPKPSLPSTPKAETPRRQPAKGNRRTTIDPASDLAPLDSQSPTVSANRRKSAASTSPVSDAAGSARPGTATSSRSTVPTGPRKTSSSRSATPKRSASPRKAPPVPRVPSGFLGDASTGASAEPSVPGLGQQDDVDNLAAGVRKLNIKLKVPNPEENAAREKAAERRFMDSISTPTDISAPASAPTGTMSPDEPVKSDRPDSPDISAIPNTITVNRPGNSRKASPMQSSFVSPPVTPGFPGTNQESLQQEPATVPVAQSKHALPVFTSTDAIPFAPVPPPAPAPAESESRPSTSSHANSEQSGFIFVDEQDYQERRA